MSTTCTSYIIFMCILALYYILYILHEELSVRYEEKSSISTNSSLFIQHLTTQFVVVLVLIFFLKQSFNTSMFVLCTCKSMFVGCVTLLALLPLLSMWCYVLQSISPPLVQVYLCPDVMQLYDELVYELCYNSLFLLYRRQSLQTEIENHQPRISTLVETGEDLISEDHPQSEEFKGLMLDLLDRWQNLKDAVEKRKERLVLSDTAQQVLQCDWLKERID